MSCNRHANRREFLFLLLQCRDKKPSLSRTKRPTDLRNQQALFLTPLFYTKDSHYVDRGYLEGDTPLDKASIEGSLSPLSGASSQEIRLSEEILAEISGVCTTGTDQCPELNNTNCGVSYTSIGAPASSLSSCCFNSASCSCCDWSIRCVATVWTTKAIASTRLYGLFRLSMASPSQEVDSE